MATQTATIRKDTRAAGNGTAGHAIVSRSEWLGARLDLLRKEKALTRMRDALSKERRALPWVEITKPYVFDTPQGRKPLADLFGGRSQLIIYHFMLGPGWAEGCKSCSFVADHIDGALVHLAARDVTLMAVSRAPLAEIRSFQQRMGWKFPWASSFGEDFNFDFHVSFAKESVGKGDDVYYNYAAGRFPSEEAPGVSAFIKDGSGRVFHTYSAYARGLDHLVNAYNYLDLAPKGRDEEGLGFTMEWVRHHDKYETAGPATAAACGCAAAEARS